MLQNNFNFLTANNSQQEKKIAVAISGGADSTALLFLIKKYLPFATVIGLTVDHGLRQESRQEAESVQKLCLSLGVEHHILTWIPPQKCSQQTAREARYHLLTQFCKEHGILNLCVAHHQDDLLETFIMRIWQKSKLLGLSSISAVIQKNEINIIRPLLNIKKSTLIKFLEQSNIPFIEDPSNTYKKYLRTIARTTPLISHEKKIFLNFINLIGRLRSYLETIVLEKIQQLAIWETPHTLRINAELITSAPNILRPIFIEKIARIMGYSDFLKSNTTHSIIQNLSKNLSTTGYLLYWHWNKNFIYVTYEKKSPVPDVYVNHSGTYHFDAYTIELEALTTNPEPFHLKFITRKDCIHLKKTDRINFLLSQTKSSIASFFFEDLIVFLDEVEYPFQRLQEKGWNIKSFSKHTQAVTFVPFTVLPSSGVVT